MKRIRLLTSLQHTCILLLLLACNHRDPMPGMDAPGSFQPSADVYRFLMNGVLWRGRGEAYYSSSSLDLRAYRANQTMTISLGGIPIRERVYEFDQNTAEVSVAYSDAQQKCQYDRMLNNAVTYSGMLEIVFIDPINKNISGRFRFSLESSGCKTLHIEQGVFELTYSE